MESNSLVVVIPVIHMAGLDNRFNPELKRHVGALYKIENVPCPLCKEYQKPGLNCSACPFYAFKVEGSSQFGCMAWLDAVALELGISEFIPELHAKFVCWHTIDDLEAHRQLLTIRGPILNRGKYIKWTV